MKRVLMVLVMVGYLLGPLMTTAAQQAPAAAPRVAVTKHSGQFNGVAVNYTATVQEHFLREETVVPTSAGAAATMTTITYVRDGVKNAARRPVLFLFNGGPGASSSPLHMSAMGPVRRVGGPNSTEPKWETNPFSPIDAMDLVFIDPVGTGFSRPLPGQDPKRYYTVNGDASAVTAVVAAWLKANQREASPKFLVGESYGTIRAAVIAKNSGPLKFDGVLLVAVAPDVPGREMPFVASLPTMAAGAWFHNRIDRAGMSVEQFYQDALDFARTDYVAALIRGASLSASEKHGIAERMSKLIGLPATLIEAENLRVSKNTWMFNLLKDKELRTGLLDVRVTAKLEPGAVGDIDDPALGVVPPRAPGAAAGAAPPTPQSVGAVESPAVGAYLTKELKYPSADPYYGVNFLVNAQWQRDGSRNAFEGLVEAMKADPKLRLYWSGGLYDLTTPAYGAAYTFDQAGVPSDRVTGALFPGPHGVYNGEENLEHFNASVRDFVLGKADDPKLTLLLKPGPVGKAGVPYIDVTLTIEKADTAAGKPLLALPIVIANTVTAADTLQKLEARDANGAIKLTTRDDPVALAYARYWTSARTVKGDLTVRYRAPIDNTPPRRGSGPPYQLRTEGGGVSGVGNTFILLPETLKPYRILIRWDLSALGKAATATSSYGDGDVELPAGPAARLSSTIFMAGPMQRYPEASQGAFSAAWMGTPPFDPAPLAAWTEKLHAWMSDYFKDAAEPPYRVFLRFNPINAGGGSALTNSFLATYGTTGDADALRSTIAHEMTHTWTAAGGPGQWYSEGNAVYYQRLLPLRAGLFTPAEFLADLNDTARRYYSNALNTTPDAEIGPRFWEDTRIRVLPYDRGGMYFAALDEKIRAASSGKRKVDDLVFEAIARNRRGERTSDAQWREMLAKELGPAGPQLHEAMLRGDVMLPGAKAFGPCFTRTTGKVRRFELGFDPQSLVGDVKTIRGLQPDSEAAKAGLKDGDVVTYAAALDSIQGDPARTLTLQATRGGKTLPVTYLPRGASVDVWQWERVPGVADRACVF
jgi:carboxypeptidase C (cathepsin A)/predicted metalloprotease with PDZ domain